MDNKNDISFGVSDKALFLREKIDDTEQDLADVFPTDIPYETGLLFYVNGPNNYKLVFKDGTVSAYLNGQLVYDRIGIKLIHGYAGFKVWDDLKNGDGVLENLRVYQSQ